MKLLISIDFDTIIITFPFQGGWIMKKGKLVILLAIAVNLFTANIKEMFFSKHTAPVEEKLNLPKIPTNDDKTFFLTPNT